MLGFKFTCTENTVIISAEHTIETMYNTFLINHPKYDARLPGRDVKLTAGDAPAGNDPRLFAYLEMQTETRSLLGLLLCSPPRKSRTSCSWLASSGNKRDA